MSNGFVTLATFVGLLVLVLSGCQSPPESDHRAVMTDQLEPYQCGSIQRLHTLGGVFLASQPTVSDFEQAKKGGVRAVINLRRAGEIKEFDERSVVEGLGLVYENPAFGGPSELTDSVLDETRALLRTMERPIMLHCGSANRVGAVWLAHRVLDDGLEVEAALAEAKQVGLRSPDLERIVLDYVERKR